MGGGVVKKDDAGWRRGKEGRRRSGRRRKRGILNKQDAVDRNGAVTGLMR